MCLIAPLAESSQSFRGEIVKTSAALSSSSSIGWIGATVGAVASAEPAITTCWGSLAGACCERFAMLPISEVGQDVHSDAVRLMSLWSCQGGEVSETVVYSLTLLLVRTMRTIRRKVNSAYCAHCALVG
jgi:hypothetical protein